MSYSILVNNLVDKFIDCHWNNLTWINICNDDQLLIEAYESKFDSDLDYEKIESIEDKADFISQSDEIKDLENCYLPMYNYIYRLNKYPLDSQIKKLISAASNISIISDENDNCYMSLNCCGSDCSDMLAYAYMVIDQFIPSDLINPQRLHLNKNEYNKLMKFIEKQSKSFITNL